MMEINEQREDRWVAALCHASMGVMMIGVFVPLVVWVTQKERSPFLRFQALQALAYQLTGFAAYFILNGCMMVGSFGMFGVTFLTGMWTGTNGSADPTLNAVTIFLMFMSMGVMFLFIGAMMLGAPAYFIVAMWGGLRVLGGHDFRYPIIGRIIASRLESPAPAAAGD